LAALWQRLGLAAIIAEQRKGRQLACAVKRALFAMVANRACAPCSTLSCDEPWRREDVRLAGTDTRALPHLSRALDGLDAHKDGMEQALYCRRAALLTVDGALLFYAPTALPCAIDEMDQGHGDADRVAGSLAAGAKVSQALRQRGMAYNVPQKLDHRIS
jgi:hypothetical protein